MTSHTFDNRACVLGEGPLWHPTRKQLFWFDILNKKLLSRSDDRPLEWVFDDTVSTAGWIDHDTLLMASATGLWRFDITTGIRKLIVPLEEANTLTRSNDGRADPWGGFWIGTMGYNAENKAGAIYRFYQGELRRLFSDITISNSICFAPDRARAYFADTSKQVILYVALDDTGWPAAAPRIFLDLSTQDLNPDGAVVDANGCLWVAQWGASRVACYSPDGQFLRAIHLPARHVSCPAFGGENYDCLFATSATQGMDPETLGRDSQEGFTFVTQGITRGRPEPQVIL